jgi:hypothetical protein
MNSAKTKRYHRVRNVHEPNYMLEGERAFQNGEKIINNPYNKETETHEFTKWESGFEYAKAKAEI